MAIRPPGQTPAGGSGPSSFAQLATFVLSSLVVDDGSGTAEIAADNVAAILGILMEALGQLLQNGPQPISRLRRELPKAAAELAKQRNVCAQTSFPRIVNFFIKLLLMSAALKGPDGEVIERNVRSEASKIASLTQDATDLVESYLLEQILKQSDVKDREHWQLALALFREFDQSVPLDDKLDRIAVLMAGLSDRIALTNEGTYDYIGKAASGIPCFRIASKSGANGAKAYKGCRQKRVLTAELSQDRKYLAKRRLSAGS